MGFSKFIVITLLAATLLTSVDSAENCPKGNFKGSQKRFNVMFKDKKDAESHFKWLSECFDRNVKQTASVDFSKPIDKTDVVDFSVEDAFHGYSANFHPKFVEEVLLKRMEIQVAEEDAEVKISSVVPRSVQRKPIFNLDRIDQNRFPLDGKYEFPDSAGKGVNVYVVDTGIRITHKEFEGRATFGKACCFGCRKVDDHGHGTHVAGTVAGKNFGVSKKSNLIAVKVFDKSGSGSYSDVICGLSFVLDQHRKSKNKKTVVNMSLGGVRSDVLNKMVETLTKKGIHVVVAAGNNAADACKFSPASEKTAITVGATEDINDRLTVFSNFGTCVDIFAPGLNIKSAGFETNNSTQVLSGTSMSSPHVAGTVALIIANDGNTSPANMAKKLKQLGTNNVIPRETLNGSPNKFLRVPKSKK
ncbi:15826_t:CDS:2 [Funneliformis mosseae]|uniref:15826_t:CDS:1 n=1 Tax=Funneliformis mosseae TaxID=27381 RepID=A0A9N9B804_FUNMO|nr:15826_t:CDS:2 [Funneliformis mosseae]